MMTEKEGRKERVSIHEMSVSFCIKSDIIQWEDESLLMRDDLFRQRMNILVL